MCFLVRNTRHKSLIFFFFKTCCLLFCLGVGANSARARHVVGAILTGVATFESDTGNSCFPKRKTWACYCVTFRKRRPTRNICFCFKFWRLDGSRWRLHLSFFREGQYKCWEMKGYLCQVPDIKIDSLCFHYLCTNSVATQAVPIRHSAFSQINMQSTAESAYNRFVYFGLKGKFVSGRGSFLWVWWCGWIIPH